MAGQHNKVGRTSLEVLIFLEGEEEKVKTEGRYIPNGRNVSNAAPG